MLRTCRYGLLAGPATLLAPTLFVLSLSTGLISATDATAQPAPTRQDSAAAGNSTPVRPEADSPSGWAESPASEAAAEPSSAADWLPSDTLAMVRISDLARFRQRWEGSSFGAQMDDPALADFFDSVARQLSGFEQGLGIELSTLWQEVNGELALALVRDGRGTLSLVGIAATADQASANSLAGRLEQQLREEDAEPTTLETESAELRSWRRRGDRGLSNVNYLVRGGAIVFSDRIQTLAELAARQQSEAETTLAASDDFSHVMRRVVPGGRDTGANWYVNPVAVVRAAVQSGLGGSGTQRTTSPLFEQMIDGVRLDQIRGLGGSFWLGQGGVDSASMTYGYVETPLEGPLRALTLPATPQQPPDWVKDDVSLYTQINWGADRFAKVIGDALRAEQPVNEPDRGLGSNRVGDSELTYSQLAERLVGPLHVAAEVPQGVTELTRQRAIVALGIDDAAAMRAFVGRIAARAGAEVTRSGEYDVHQWEMELPAATGGLPPLSLAVAVTEDAILLSPNPEYLRATVGPRAGLRPLADSPDYQEVASKFPERTSMISYQRQDSRLEGLYEQLRGGALDVGGVPGLAGQLFDFDFSKLPPFPAMSRYLQTTGSFIVPEEDGFRIVRFALPPREQ